MGPTPSNSIMKTLKFFTAFGILCTVGTINAQYSGYSGYQGPTTEPEPETTPHHGEQPIEINPIENPFCYSSPECRKEFDGRKGGVCINMREVSMKEIGKLVHKNKEAKGNLCGEWDQGKDCCRCFKNKCEQTNKCKKKNGICRKKIAGYPPNNFVKLHCRGDCAC